MVARLRPGATEQAAWDASVGALLSRVAYLRHLTGAHRPAALLHAGVVLADLQVCSKSRGVAWLDTATRMRRSTCVTDQRIMQPAACIAYVLTGS